MYKFKHTTACFPPCTTGVKRRWHELRWEGKRRLKRKRERYNHREYSSLMIAWTTSQVCPLHEGATLAAATRTALLHLPRVTDEKIALQRWSGEAGTGLERRCDDSGRCADHGLRTGGEENVRRAASLRPTFCGRGRLLGAHRIVGVVQVHIRLTHAVY